VILPRTAGEVPHEVRRRGLVSHALRNSLEFSFASSPRLAPSGSLCSPPPPPLRGRISSLTARSTAASAAATARSASPTRPKPVRRGEGPAVGADGRLARRDLKVRSTPQPRNDDRESYERKKEREAERRQTRSPTVRAFGAAARACTRARLSAFHRGSSWRCRNISVQLQARLPGTRPPRLFC